jgi:hypothetical protein
MFQKLVGYLLFVWACLVAEEAPLQRVLYNGIDHYQTMRIRIESINRIDKPPADFIEHLEFSQFING